MILLALLAACGTPTGTCVYGSAEQENCTNLAIEANCLSENGERFEAVGDCEAEGFAVDCSDGQGAYFARSLDECGNSGR